MGYFYNMPGAYLAAQQERERVREYEQQRKDAAGSFWDDIAGIVGGAVVGFIGSGFNPLGAAAGAASAIVGDVTKSPQFAGAASSMIMKKWGNHTGTQTSSFDPNKWANGTYGGSPWVSTSIGGSGGSGAYGGGGAGSDSGGPY